MEIIATKIFRFVEVATQLRRHEEICGILRFYKWTAVIYMNREGCE